MKKSSSVKPHLLSQARPLSRPNSTYPRIVQPKMPTVSQKPRQPVAPPVYRPQAVPKVLQKKTLQNHASQSAQAGRQPVAPPVYRPQPVPKVLQTKQTAYQPTNQTKRAPVAPRVYSPQPIPRVLQRKVACGQQAHTPVQSQTARQVANTCINPGPKGHTVHKAGQVIQQMQLGTGRVTVHRKHQAAVSMRAVIQRKSLVVDVNYNLGVKKTLQIEVGDDGTITGAELRSQVIALYEPRLANMSQYIKIIMGQTLIKDDGTLYSPPELSTLSIVYQDQQHRAAKRDAEGLDQVLIDLAKKADKCIIGCFLVSTAWNIDQLNNQQHLAGILSAIGSDKALMVVLIDPNFGTESLKGQVVDYLTTKADVEVEVATEQGFPMYVVKKFKDSDVKADIAIIYVGKAVNQPTQDRMKELGIGKWYCD
jgi:hypothetical protein